MSPSRRISTSLFACGLAAALAILALDSTARADIAWSTAVGIANDNDVLAAGAAVYAYDWANANIAVNGVNFTGTSVDTGAVDANLSLGSGFGSALAACNTGASGAFGALTTAYQTLLGGLVYGANSTVTMNNLQSGHQYAVQVWDCDTNVSSGQYTTLSSGASTQRIYANPTGVYGGVGQYSVGYFTASGASQAFTNGTNDGTTMPAMTAMQLRDVTNIGYWNGLGGSFWDGNTTANFCTNVYSAPLANGTFAAAAALVPNVYFGDYYYNGSGTVAVAQNSVTVGAGGVSAAAVNFTNNSVPYTISSADSAGITGATAVNVVGGGMVTFVGTNTYTGATTISSGTLSVGGAGLLGGGNYAGNISNSGALIVNSSSNQTFSGVISGGGSLTQAGSGVLTLANGNTYSGGTTVNGGTLQLAPPSGTYYSISGNLVINSGAAVDVNGVWGLGYSGYYVSAATINNGTLAFTATGNIGGTAASNITMSGGTISGTPFDWYSATSGNPTLATSASSTPAVISSGINLRLGTGSLSFNVAQGTVPGGVDLLVSGPIVNGSGGNNSNIVKMGAGVLCLSGSNTYTGNTTVNGGTLQIGGAGVLGGGNYAGNISNSGALIVNTSANQTFSGAISGGGGLTQAGPGALVLTGANTYNGATTVSGGTLTTYQALLNTPSVAVASGGAFDAEVTNATYNGVSFLAPWYVSGTVYSGSGVTQTMGNVSLGGGTLSGNAVGLGSDGNYTVNGASYSITSSGNSLINALAGLSLQGAAALGIDVVNPGDVLTISASVSDLGSATAGIAKSGSGTLVLSANDAYSGATTISAGTLQIGGAGLLGGGNYAGNISIANSAALVTNSSGNQTFSGVLSGGGALTKTGSGVLTLSNGNTYSGGTTVNGGTLQLVPPSGTYYSISGNLVINSGAAVDVNGVWGLGYTNYYVTAATINNGTLAFTATGAVGGTVATNVLMSGGTISGTPFDWYSASAGSPTLATSASSTPAVISSGINLRLTTAGSLTFNIAQGTVPGGIDLLVSGPIINGSGGNNGGNIVKTGSGVLCFSASNSYTGNTAVNGGTLEIGGSGLLGGGSYAGNISIANSAALLVNSSSNQTFSGVLSGGGSLTQAGPGALTASNANTYSGGTTLSGGALDLANQNAAGNGTVTMAGGSLVFAASAGGAFSLGGLSAASSGPGYDIALQDNASSPNPVAVTVGSDNANTTYAGNLSGSGSLTKNGSGLLTLTGNNTYLGTTTISDGTLQVLGAGVLGGGNYAGNISIAGSSAMVMNTSGNQTFSGVLSGSGSLTQAGPGALTASNANTYSGGTTLSGGTLDLANQNAAGNGTVTMAGGSLVFAASAGGAFSLGGLSAVSSGPGYDIALQDNASSPNPVAVTVGGDNANTTYAGNLSGSGSLTKNGSGLLTLTGNNTYLGTTTISDGTLQVLGAGVLGGGNYSAAISIASSSALLMNASGNQTFGGAITGAGGLTQSGAGALSLLNISYSGNTTVNAGTLEFVDTRPLDVSSTVNIGPAGTLTIYSDCSFANRNNSISTSGGLFWASITGGGTLNKTGPGWTGLCTAVSLTGQVNVLNGGLGDDTAALNYAGNSAGLYLAPGTVFDIRGQSAYWNALTGSGSVVNSYQSGTDVLYIGVANGSGTFSGTIQDDGGAMTSGGAGGAVNLTKNGTGMQVLSGSLAYSGATNVNGGTLAENSLGISSAASIASAATLQWDFNSLQQVAAAIAISGSGTLLKTGTGIASLATDGHSATISMGSGGLIDIEGGVLGNNWGTVVWTGNQASMNIASTAAFDIRAQNATIGALTGSGTVANTYQSGVNVLTVGAGDASGTFSGTICGAGDGNALNTGYPGQGDFNAGVTALTKTGNGIQVLSGDNVYTGPTTIAAGTLQIGNGTSGEGLASPTISNSGALAFNHADTLTYAGSISGPGSLTKTGTGMLVLAGNSSYSGDTTVNAGALAVNGSLWQYNQLNVDGGVLSGSGTVGNVVTHGGALAPGYNAGAGTLNATSLFLNPGPLDLTLGAASGGNGFINVSNGQVTLATTNNDIAVDLTSGGSLAPGTYAIISYGTLATGPGTGTPAQAFSVSDSGNFAADTLSFTASGNAIDLVVTPTTGGGPINGTWNTNGPGTWSTSGNWSGGVPGSGQDTAVFGTVLTSGTATVTLDGSRSLASLGFSTTGANSYVISPSTGVALTLANTATSTAALSNSGGNQTINAPIVLGSNLSVSATTGSALTIAGGISESSTGTSVSVSGGGEAILSGTDTYTGGTNVTAATLAITSASALSSTGVVTISGGGQLVLGSGSGIGALLTASAPISSGAVALSAAAAVPATLAPIGNSFENMATLGGAPSLSQGGGGSAVGGSAPAVPEPGTLALLAVAVAAALAVRRKRE